MLHARSFDDHACLCEYPILEVFRWTRVFTWIFGIWFVCNHVGVVVGAAVSIVGVSDRARPPSWAAPISRPSFAQEHEARKMRRLQSETGPLYAQNLDAEQCER